jgi:uncharacterized protein (TIGR03000 family)
VVGVLSALALLLWANPSQAQVRGFRGRMVRPVRPVFPPNRMPGWDWWRIYPWSPYNYGRNPYNPAWYPYPYTYPYPVYTPYSYSAYVPPDVSNPVTYPMTPPTPSLENIYGASDAPRQVLVPEPSGALKVPPADAAVIRLLLPDRFGEVWFDGVETESVGTTRYYVTPELPHDKSLRYVVKAKFRRGGETVTEERTVKVSPGKTAVVDFNRAPATE